VKEYKVALGLSLLCPCVSIRGSLAWGYFD